MPVGVTAPREVSSLLSDDFDLRLLKTFTTASNTWMGRKKNRRSFHMVIMMSFGTGSIVLRKHYASYDTVTRGFK